MTPYEHKAPRRATRWVGVFAVLLAAATGTLVVSALRAQTRADSDQAATEAAEREASERTAGKGTVWATGQNAFSFPLANLNDAERTRFVIGNSFFKRNWVEAPASTKARDGLGPHFIARSCAACHLLDGRSAPPDWARTLLPGPDAESSVGLLLRLSISGQPDAQHGVVPEPVYGDQLGTAAVQGVKPEGHIEIRSRPIEVRFADGSTHTLQQPIYSITRLGYGAMAPNVLISPRVAPQVIGMGLLEAIPEAEILGNARAQAALNGPLTAAIKGQPNRVWDAYAGREVLGRFGWKANVGSVAHQTAGAFLGDIGITSRVNWREACTPAQTDCLQAAHGGGKGIERQNGRKTTVLVTAAQASPEQPEIDEQTLNQVIFYTATLAPPARRRVNDLQVQKGQALFHQAQCAVCHRPSYTTSTQDSSGAGGFPRLASPALKGQRIWPYTDLLLHDMGEALADGRPDFQANGRQWRTPPLWGIGLIRDVNGHQRLLHDGRAKGVLEAVLWHGGEAEASKQQVLKMNAEQRAALVAFLESL
ncbi:thiol oxidoreductase [Hylemonella gracilis str. Niagara R]|uniref:Thiol oxidoreductase n=1 Tax=Hylemonella gracilis str. Niagara R TaxID=1458275 RepID=A0A016XFZ1_9BURK|nr:di-heme oxidoredictase family protein [Hylemonella gracilis]EYC50477.1 thiol oxidoreductase [Hylemonella gracilis str. Niagara R]